MNNSASNLAKRNSVKLLVAGIPNGQNFTVEFKRKKPKKMPDGSISEFRTMECITGCTKHLKGSKSTTKDKPDLVGVFERSRKSGQFVAGSSADYRCFSADLVTKLVIAGQTYTFDIFV